MYTVYNNFFCCCFIRKKNEDIELLLFNDLKGLEFKTVFGTYWIKIIKVFFKNLR